MYQYTQMVAVLHCIITDIENSRIKNNIKNWKFNFKFNNIKDDYLDQINELKNEIECWEKADPKLKELREKVMKNENIDDINIEISFAIINNINNLCYILDRDDPPIHRLMTPDDLKQIIVEIIKEHKIACNSIELEMLEVEKEILLEIY